MNAVIIHSTRDAWFVEQLTERFRLAGVQTWLDNEETRTDDNVLDRVTRESEDIGFVIAVISQGFKASRWMSHEISTWMLKEALGDKPVILPLLLEACDVPSFLADHLYFDFCDAFDGPVEALIETITADPNACSRSSQIGTLQRNVSHQLDQIKEAFSRGKLTLFCGSGVSISAGIPGWKVFLRLLLSDLLEQDGAPGGDGQPTSLAKVYQDYFELSPLIVAQYLKNALGTDFQRTVRDALYAAGTTSSPLIDAVCELCRPQRERLAVHSIVTFNFDDLIEQILEENKIKHQAIFKEGQRPAPSELPIYHVHGYLPHDLDPDLTAEIVFSEDAYHSKFIDPFSWSNLTQLNQLYQNTCLFVGLGMTDPNLRRLLDVAMRKNPEKSLEHFIFKKRYEVSDLTSHISGLGGTSDAFKEASRLTRMAEILEERDCNNLGLNVIWVDNFDEIPDFFLRIANV
jgi:hypothetical protein